MFFCFFSCLLAVLPFYHIPLRLFTIYKTASVKKFKKYTRIFNCNRIVKRRLSEIKCFNMSSCLINCFTFLANSKNNNSGKKNAQQNPWKIEKKRRKNTPINFEFLLHEYFLNCLHSLRIENQWSFWPDSA